MVITFGNHFQPQLNVLLFSPNICKNLSILTILPRYLHMRLLLRGVIFFEFPRSRVYLCNRMKDDKREMKRRKKAESEIEMNSLDNFELEFKMMENQMYSWLISSAYPQINTKSERSKNKKNKTISNNNKSKGDQKK